MKEKILAKAISGDKKAFAKIYNELFDGLWRYIMSRIGDKDITSDITSESFIALYENIKNIDESRAVKSYLYQIAKSKMTKHYKKEKSQPLSAYDLDWVEIKDDFSDSKDKRETREQNRVHVEKILAELPDNYCEVLRLRFLSELKISEVAEILDKTESNIKVIQHRALKKAKELISKGDIEL